MGIVSEKNICVVIPAYNVANSIGDVVKGALRHVSAVFVAFAGFASAIPAYQIHSPEQNFYGIDQE